MGGEREAHASVANTKDGAEILTVHVAGEASKKGVHVEGGADVMTIKNDKNPGMALDVKVLGGGAEVEAVCDLNKGTVKAGVEAGVHLIEADVGPFHLELGAGVDTGVGVEDASIEMKVGGWGIVVGKKVGVAVAGSEATVDLVGVAETVKTVFTGDK